MALKDIWNANKAEFGQKQLQQIIAIAGEGKLLDGNSTSDERRDFFRIVPREKLSEYAHQCLENKFDENGRALQDIVNEIGRRLGFQVEDGLYRGKKGFSGHDGLWILKNDRNIVVEVKTTDAYSIDLETIVGYRRKLAQKGIIAQETTSILLVVGRKETGALEAQIRGSRHSWDMRIISVKGILRLLELKETLDDPSTALKISGILIPQEFTRLDSIIDLVFDTAEEIAAPQEEDLESESVDEGNSSKGKKSKFTPVKFHEACAIRIGENLGASLIRESRSIYKDPTSNTRFWIAVSRAHGKESAPDYWFAFHPHQRDQLREVDASFVALGCASEDIIILIPFSKFEPFLESTWTTKKKDRMYWHVQIRVRNGDYQWALKKGEENVALNDYLLPR